MTTVAAARPGRPPKPMSAWRLERLRMIRTPRAIALGAVYLFFGLLGPVTAKYLQDIVNRAQSGVQIIVARPTAKDGIANYISQAGRTGLVAAHRPPLRGQRRRRGRRLHPGNAGRLV